MHSKKPGTACQSDSCCPNDRADVQLPELEINTQPEEFETDQPPYYHHDIF